MELGPCQPTMSSFKNNEFPKSKDSTGKLRSFHENFYFCKTLDNQTPVKRLWLCYSPSKDRIFCGTCKLFGLPKAKKQKLASIGSNDWTNLSRNISHHESLPEHLQAEINQSLYNKNTRIDTKMLHSANQNVAENRAIVSVIIEVLLFAARQNIAIRGHNETLQSLNRGNFLELITLISKYHPTLKIHLNKIQHNLNVTQTTFLSNKSQNKILNILCEIIRSKILLQVKAAKIFSVIIDTTTDVSNTEQLTFLLRYVDNKGVIQERLVALETAPDGTGKGMFQTFCSITAKYNINWKEHLCARSFDGAASMQGEYTGLRTLIQKENPKALYVWCFAHLLNLVIVYTCDCCTDTKNFFGNVQALVAFMRARKRTALFLDYQKLMYPNDRIHRMKGFSSTRWTSHGSAINVIYNKFDALVEVLNKLTLSSDRITASTATNILPSILILHLLFL